MTPSCVVPQKEFDEKCVSETGDDLNDCGEGSSPDIINLNTKICGKTSTFLDGVDTRYDVDHFIFELEEAGGIRVIMNIPDSSFLAYLQLVKVPADNVCNVVRGITDDFIDSADSNANSGADTDTGIARYLPDKLDGSTDYVITAECLGEGTYRLKVNIETFLASPGDTSCQGTAGLPYTLLVETNWAPIPCPAQGTLSLGDACSSSCPNSCGAGLECDGS